jgi:hypothetical protein
MTKPHVPNKVTIEALEDARVGNTVPFSLDEADDFDQWWESYSLGPFGLTKEDMKNAFSSGISAGLDIAYEYQ